MIQELFNAMLALMLAKFVLNDVPHALGVALNSANGFSCSYPELTRLLTPQGSLDTVLRGYYHIAKGITNEFEVNNVAKKLLRGFNTYFREWSPLSPAEVLQETDLTDAYTKLKYGDRIGKVEAIDKIVSIQHGGGALMTYFFPDEMTPALNFEIIDFLDSLSG